MPPLQLHPEKHWEMAQDRLKRQLQGALPNLFLLGELPLGSLEQTLELSRHLFAVLLVLPSPLWLDGIYFWRPGFFWCLWEEEINCILKDEKNSVWGSFWEDAHIA